MLRQLSTLESGVFVSVFRLANVALTGGVGARDGVAPVGLLIEQCFKSFGNQ